MQRISNLPSLKNIIFFSISLICFILFFIFQRYIFSTDLQQTQQVINNVFSNLQSPLLNKIVIFITYTGNTLPLLFFTLFISILLFQHRFKIESYFLIFHFITLALSNYLLKLHYQRERPLFNPLIEQGGYSFPSGHAMINLGMGIFISYLIFKVLQYFKPAMFMTLVIMLYVLLIGISRVYVSVHFLSDVIGGWLFGTGVACFMIVLYEWVHQKYLTKDILYYKRKY
ncbi:MAG TPA: PAP2 family protein [Firmicutes bacterium]|nr:PAP2 family protein [Bacillota bacterium]